MKHYQLLATISIDGCLLNLTPESHWVLMATLYSLSDYINLAGNGNNLFDNIVTPTLWRVAHNTLQALQILHARHMWQ